MKRHVWSWLLVACPPHPAVFLLWLLRPLRKQFSQGERHCMLHLNHTPGNTFCARCCIPINCGVCPRLVCVCAMHVCIAQQPPSLKTLELSDTTLLADGSRTHLFWTHLLFVVASALHTPQLITLPYCHHFLRTSRSCVVVIFGWCFSTKQGKLCPVSRDATSKQSP